MMEERQCTQTPRVFYKYLKKINKNIIEEALMVFDNDEPHHVLKGNKLDNFISLFIYIL